jgi:hypothetical protein
MGINSNHWYDFFLHWPAELNRRGIIVTSFNEQIFFSAFWTSETFLMVERQTPDAIGARSIILPYDQIIALKISDVVKAKQFKATGFEGGVSKP